MKFLHHNYTKDSEVFIQLTIYEISAILCFSLNTRFSHDAQLDNRLKYLDKLGRNMYNKNDVMKRCYEIML